MTPLIGYQEAALRLGLKLGTLRAMVSRKQVPHLRIGTRLVLFDVAELDGFLATKRVAVTDRDGPRDTTPSGERTTELRSIRGGVR